MSTDRGDAGAQPVRPMPGSPEAAARGCRCSTLANAAYRLGADLSALVDSESRLVRGHREPRRFAYRRWIAKPKLVPWPAP